MDPISRKVPYRHLNEVEVEMAAVGLSGGEVDADIEGRGLDGMQASPPAGKYAPARPAGVSGTGTLVLGSMIAAGVQFGWALQLSLLTPYIQTLGIEHAFSSFIWLCGPITGLVVQPCVGVWSDQCHSKYGRRRPFIFVGALMISVAVIIIGFSADMGYFLGDTDEHCSTYRGPRWRAAVIFVIGFWMLDLANNTVQGPARALLADLSGPSQCNLANAIFCSWMALGNILGFSSGASGQWHRWFPFLTTRACCEACGNLKAAFFVAVVFLMLCTSVTLYFAKEIPLAAKRASRLSDSAPLLTESQQMGHDRLNSNPQNSEYNKDKGEINGKASFNHLPDHDSDANEQIEAFKSGPSAVVVNILTGVRHLPPGMNAVLIVMVLTWLAWFPFFLFDTDWMGREVYHGNPNGTMSEIDSYHEGVREGAFGLLLNSVVLLFSSFLVEPLCKRVGARVVWGISNFIIFACMIATGIISFLSQDTRGSSEIKIASLILFSCLGFPLSITYSVPFSMTAELTAGTGGGQGLATGVLNLSIVVPQMIVSLGAGPWDALFGGGNIPAFVLASVFSLVGGMVAMYKLPNLSFKSSGFHGFG